MLGPVSPPEYKHYLLLDELYGTGDFDEARTLAEEVDRHLASSVESLARLYSRSVLYCTVLYYTVLYCTPGSGSWSATSPGSGSSSATPWRTCRLTTLRQGDIFTIQLSLGHIFFGA